MQRPFYIVTKRELGSGSRERKWNGNEEERGRGSQQTVTFAALEGEKNRERIWKVNEGLKGVGGPGSKQQVSLIL